MFWYLVFYLFLFISILNILHFGFYLVGANYYDIKQFKRRQQNQRRRHRASPTISVLIPAHNEAKTIIRCLESVRVNTYRNLQIIVIDDASTDNTRQLVRQYIAQHPTRAIKLMYKRVNSGKAAALNHALRQAVDTDLVMTLDADSVLAKQSLTKAAAYFRDPTVVGVAANVRVIENLSILGLLQRFEYMIGYRSKKFFSLTNSEFIVGGVASTYRTSTLKQVGFYDQDIITEDIALSLKIVAQGNKAKRVIYGYDVVAMTEGVQTFSQLLRQRYRWKMGNLQSIIKYRRLLLAKPDTHSRALTWYRLPMAFLGEILLLLEPLAMVYVVYVCIQLTSLMFIIGAYMTITLYLVWNILPDEHLSLKSKLKMCAYAPVMYFIMYIMNLVQLIAITRCLLHPKQILRKAATHAHWVSPDRHGQKQVQFS